MCVPDASRYLDETADFRCERSLKVEDRELREEESREETGSRATKVSRSERSS